MCRRRKGGRCTKGTAGKLILTQLNLVLLWTAANGIFNSGFTTE